MSDTDAAPASDAPDADARPVVRLRPRSGRRFHAGAPWIYADELVMDRRTRKLAPGALATLEDADRRVQGVVAVNTGSGIAARLLDRDPEAAIDAAWLEGRFAAALALRERLFDTPHYRLIHAEADGLPGLVVDRFGEALVLQPNAAWADARIEAIADAALAVTGATTAVVNAASRARGQEGMETAEARVIRGALDGPVEAPMNGAIYLADLLGGQKTGLYYDQRPNHAFVARLARGGRVLDVFSHVGGFALAALAAGAEHALAVDGSEPALALAEASARRSGLADRLECRRDDAFDAMHRLAEDGARFDAVICDPPAFAPSRNAAEAGLRAYRRTARLAARLVAPGGFLALHSCSHAAGPDAFFEASVDGIRASRREAQLIRAAGAGPDHPVHPALPETRYLKALVFRLS